MIAEALFNSPIGPLYARTSDKGLQRLDFRRDAALLDRDATNGGSSPDAAHRLLEETQRQLGEYFDGIRRSFDLPLDLEGSDFRKRVWQAIAALPFGATDSYAGVAAAAGAPGAYRAAGSACGANPVAVVVPCHRVVGADRALHGYGGGLDVKTWLLRHEGSLAGLKGIPAQMAPA